MSRELMVGVKALLQNREGKYLLASRNPEKYPEIGVNWDIIGGRIDIGAPLFDNLKREIMEEVGLELKEAPTLLMAQDILRVPDRHVVRLTYHACIDGTPKVDKTENTECRWFSLEEIRALPTEELDIFTAEVLKTCKIPEKTPA